MAVVEKEVVPRFSCTLAGTSQDIKASQQLRYQIFAQEMGAQIDGGPELRDQDHFDAHCDHLIVRNAAGEVVASTRLLTSEASVHTGGFYSEHEFDLSQINALQGRKLEVGRTCVAADYRNGTTIAVLWSGLADYVADNDIDYMFGCASIELADPDAAYRIMADIRHRYMSAPDLRVAPLKPLPNRNVEFAKTRMPPLLKAYVSLGARACGEPYWDTEFRCADVFMLLNLRELHPRYARHFLGPRLANR